MYLALLNNEQKQLYLNMAYNIVMADGIYTEKEQAVMKNYSIEMNIDFILDDLKKDFDTVVASINNISDMQQKKMIIFEIIGLALSDGYDDNEEAMIKSAAEVFGIDNDYIGKCEEIIKEYLIFQHKINGLVSV